MNERSCRICNHKESSHNTFIGCKTYCGKPIGGNICPCRRFVP